jgi:very-short-patch-repair endonuclease
METKSETLIFKNKQITRWFINDKFYYHGSEVGDVLDIKRIRSSVMNFNGDDIVSMEDKKRYGIVIYKIHRNRKAIDNRKIVLTEKGLKRFLCASRSPESIELAKFLGINTYENKFAPVETSTVSFILSAFAGQNMITQYQVDQYRIDLYFPDHKLAIECDEHAHTHRDQNYESARESYITQELKCKFVRYNPNAHDFNLAAVINEIFKHIISDKN